MATGFDDLVEQLLYDVTLSGSHGLGADEFENSVKAFYESRQPTDQTEQLNERILLFSDAPPARSTIVDEAFLDTVWHWLENHPDINIEDPPEAEAEQPSDPKHAGRRIFTNEEKAWQVIAGHGVDHARIPKRSFHCLSVIASHGPNGILQPALVQITGQDKRSVPKRTDFLADSGYIVKLQAYDGKHKTSLLKLRKFADAQRISKPSAAFPRDDYLDQGNEDEDDQTFDEVIQMLRDNDGIIAVVDLCTAFKLRKNTAIKKHFMLSVDRLLETGCVRSVKAQVENANNRFLECLQLAREPTELDREAFNGKSNAREGEDDEIDGAIEEYGNDDFIEREEDEDDSADESQHKLAEAGQRIPPQWTPDMLQNNFVFHVIDKAGPAGISSMELHKRSMGSFWKKSLDDLLLRLTDVWQVSQPSHLKHLGIVRDTEVEGRSSHFHFRTLPNFEKAVEMGLTAWEAVNGDSNDGGKKKQAKSRKSAAAPELDNFGFPKLDPKLFADEEGRASLAECAEPAKRAMSRLGVRSHTPAKARPKVAATTPSTVSTTSLTGRKKREDAGIPKKTPNTISTITPSTVSTKSPTGRKKRKDAGIRRTTLSTISTTTPTGRKKRKDAGIPRKKKVIFNLPGTSDIDMDGQATSDRSGSDADAELARSDMSITRKASGEKRSAQSAQLNDSPRITKTRKMTETPPEPHETSSELSASGASIKEVDQSATSPPLVSFNSPDAVRRRFQGWNRPGRRPNTKIAIIKSGRLKSLQGPDLSQLEPAHQLDEDVQPVEMESPELESEPPQKRSRLDEDGIQGFSMNKIFGEILDSPADDNSTLDSPTPLLAEKRRGRTPKKGRVDSEDLLKSAGRYVPTKDTASPKASATTKNLIVNLPLRRSLLESFKQQDQDRSGSGVDSANVQSRIVAFALPRAIHEGAIAAEPEEHPVSGATQVKERLSGSFASQTSTTFDISEKSLMVKFNLSRPGSQSQQAAALPVLGLNIIKPYLRSTLHNPIATAVDTEYSNRSDVGPVNVLELNDVQNNGLPTVISGTNEQLPDNDVEMDEVSGPLNETLEASEDDSEYDDFDDLSKLLPVDVDGDGYREHTTLKTGTPRQGGFIHMRRTKIVMETMQNAGGVFPGDHEMWYPFITSWQKTYAQLPDRRTVENVVNLLVKQKKLHKFSFTFRDKSGKSIQRHIITDPQVSASSTRAKKVQRAIIDAYPFRFLPREVDIAKHLRDKARQTPLTQGGTRIANGDDSKDEDPTYIPMGSRLSRSRRPGGANVPFDVKTPVEVIQTPRVSRVTSFTPRAILKIQDDSQEPVDFEADAFDSDSDSETDYDDDDSLLQVSPQQAALQGSFDLERYSHDAAATANERQGRRPMRTLKVGRETPSTLPIPTVNSPKYYSTQLFHTPTGTFGTLFEQTSKRKSRGGRPPGSGKKITSTTPKPSGTFSPPQGLDDILQRASALGHGPANPTDSRFYQFENEVDGVNAWERAMIIANRAMDSPSQTMYINHGLKQAHYLAKDPTGAFAIEFVEGSLKPMVVEHERRKRLKPERTTRTRAKTAATTSKSHYVSPYADVHHAPSLKQALPPWRSEESAQIVPGSTASLMPMPNRRGNARRSYTYETRRKGKSRASIDPADAAIQFIDRDSDHDYRPGQAVSAKKKSSVKKTNQNGLAKTSAYQRFSPEQFKRLAVAVALAKTICGGTGSISNMNYDAVALALGSQYNVEELKYQWQGPRKGGFDLPFSKKLQQAMYEPFLRAYETGELPHIDFENLQNTDWKSLLDWAEAAILPLVEGDALDHLPRQRDDFHAVPVVDLTAPAEEANGQSGMQVATRVRPRGYNISNTSTTLDQNYILEKSWIRAVMSTKYEDYHQNVAATKLRSLNAIILEQATKEMLDTKTIKWIKLNRQQPGRSYEISSYVMSQFDRWSRSHGAGFLRSLAEARTHVVGHFQHYDLLELGPDATDTQLEVLTNMVAQGLLSMSPILPERNDDFDAPYPKLSKWGHINHVYDNEKRDLPSLDIRVLYKKTPLFIIDHGLKLDVAVPTKVPEIPGESGARIPFWIDINGNVLDNIWTMAIESVLHLLVHVPGGTAKAIERAHDSKLWEWEIDIVLQWMERVGLAVRTGAGKETGGVWKGGWRASEWWYCVSLLTATTSDGQTNEEVVEA